MGHRKSEDFNWCKSVKMGGIDIVRFAFYKLPLATGKRTDGIGSLLGVRQRRSLKGGLRKRDGSWGGRWPQGKEESGEVLQMGGEWLKEAACQQ